MNELQARFKIAGRNIKNFKYADDTTLTVETEQELKNLLKKVKEGRKKKWLKTQYSKNLDRGIWSCLSMANRETVESVTDFIFLGSKITADGNCSHEIKR